SPPPRVYSSSSGSSSCTSEKAANGSEAPALPVFFLRDVGAARLALASGRRARLLCSPLQICTRFFGSRATSE
ncbi:MAG: hypothetical protein U9N44_04695, partial [Chloroflexota bacterium]|nr:hypothetical protein [Chloroflexota bacterium]